MATRQCRKQQWGWFLRWGTEKDYLIGDGEFIPWEVGEEQLKQRQAELTSDGFIIRECFSCYLGPEEEGQEAPRPEEVKGDNN